MSDDETERREELRRRRRERAEAADYPIGYGKPDPVHRFKKGNKMGSRPRKPKTAPLIDLYSIVDEVLASSVSVSVKGQRHRHQLGKVIVTQMATAAANGDARARSDLMRLASNPRRPARVIGARGNPIDYGAEVRAKIEAMAKNLEEQQKLESATSALRKPDPDKPEEG